MGLVFLLLALTGALSTNMLLRAAPLVFALVYACTFVVGAFGGGSELNREQLRARLAEKWREADEITDFIVKYWYSIKYAASSQKRAANCSFISLWSFALVGWYVYVDVPLYLIGWGFVNALLLFSIGNRVNKALFVLQHERGTHEWSIACVSLIAVADVLGNASCESIVRELDPQDVKDAVAHHALA